VCLVNFVAQQTDFPWASLCSKTMVLENAHQSLDFSDVIVFKAHGDEDAHPCLRYNS